jgi:O-acetyl-ADP-ribose deacetylase (regulator of RNase III)
MRTVDKIEILKTDITTLAVDAIMNAANTSLLG